MLIQVLVELSNKNIDKTFTYHVKEEWVPFIKKGIRVLVPFHHQELEGFVIETDSEMVDYEVKEIIDILDEEPILTEELMDLGKEMKKMYLSTLISCYQTMLPKALKAKRSAFVPIKVERYLKFVSVPDKVTEKQQQILNLLKESDKSLRDMNLISSSAVKTLLKNQAITFYEKEVFRKEYSEEKQVKYPLTEEQKSALSMIENSGKNIFLLHGVTGSGKTEVYMEFIEHIIKNGMTAIMLVPEISLTEQITTRFLKRFSSSIAVLHSRLSEGEKYDEYRRIKKGEVSIAIGARSAIFAPLQNIGAIIIDEEHSSSFKQDNNPKYSALEIAKLRMPYHPDLKIILGSATPTLESYARASKNLYQLVELKNRVNGHSLPEIELIDMNQEGKSGELYFSKSLVSKMKETLAKGEQILLLLNRRGYSSFITCKNCGYVEKCPNCDITLTYHKTSNTLRCHYCGYGTKLSSICPECKEEAMTNLGVGTEKIEEQLNNLFPSSNILRMDLDTTSKKGSHAKMIKSFQNGEYQILLGTQMIAKGLDFPNVTLVGVINADTSLNIPSFKSSEDTFQLLSQVAGRSGRGKSEGNVVIQTYNPDHYVFEYVKKHDYFGFYQQEMNIRKQLNYPPYFYLTSIKVMSSNYEIAKKVSNEVGQVLRKHLTSSTVLGPAVAGVFRMNNIYRFQIIIKYKKEEQLYLILEKMLEHYKSNANVKIDIDFNPNHI